MTVRAFECRAPRTGHVLGFVALSRAEEWPLATRIVRVRIGDDWRCALLDRSRVVEVEGMLLRDAVLSDERDCPECAQTPPPPAPPAEPAPEPAHHGDAPQVQAAAISIADVKMVVVLVRRDLVDSPGEAAMLVDAVRPRFGGAAIVLMGQDEDGTAHYHGDPDVVALLTGVPVERMPWRTYSLR
jgi:hypothetical protein